MPASCDGSDAPAAHAGLGHTLPALQPCRDARTPLEAPAATSPSGTGPDAVAGDGGATASAAEGDAEASATGNGAGDIFERLRALQRAEQSTDPSRHWGDAERLVRDLLEDISSSPDGRGADEQRDDLADALAQAAPTAVDSDSFGLLHYAAMYGDTEALATLLRKRANLNARTKVHETPLMLAAYYRHAEVCALLLAHRARPDLADWQGRTSLAAAKSSKCGRGRDDNAAAQRRCVELLEDRAARDHAAGPPREVEELRVQGNAFFRKKRYEEAAAAYSLGLSFLDDAGLYANRAACYLQLGKPLEAKLDARKAVGLAGEAGHVKASWRVARSCLALGELDAADEALREALGRTPEDAALRQLRNEVALERRKRLGR